MDTNTEFPVGPLPTGQALNILREGTARVEGLFRLGSNDTLLVGLQSPSGNLRAVYKPVRGERPLWDFPPGTLGKREAAAFHVAQYAGWNFVPPTVFRTDGPLGPGSFQEYLPLHLEENYFKIREEDPAALRRVAAFDVVINNADRKAMHIARDSAGRIWLIDHGVCFHTQWKVRTVIWEYAGETLPPDVREGLERLKASSPQLSDALAGLLQTEEFQSMMARIDVLLTTGSFPEPGPGISIPWPLLA